MGTPPPTEFKLTRADGAAGDGFGFSVAVDGNYAVVGAPFDDNSKGLAAGSAYVWHWTGTVWEEVTKLTASDGSSDGNFG